MNHDPNPVAPISDAQRERVVGCARSWLAVGIAKAESATNRDILALDARLTAAEARADAAENQAAHNLDLRDALGHLRGPRRCGL